MCQAPIGRIVNVDGNKITVDCNGKKALLKSLIPDLSVGEYVFFSSNMVIDRIEKEEALLILGDKK